MRLHDGTVISRAEVSPHKFGGDPMAEYLWMLSLDSSYDRCTGDCVEWVVWVAQFGKRLLCSDPQGFVWIDQYPSVERANEAFEATEARYCEYEGYE